MSGHSHWAGIKHKKGVTDQKRGVLFSKLLAAITAAARSEPDPNFNPRLRSAIQKARENQVPNENIERAVKRASEAGNNLEDLRFEAYGPGGIALVIEAISDNRNRTVAEIKKIIGDHGGKWAEPGSVLWGFEDDGQGGWKAKFPQKTSSEAELESLVSALDDHGDVQKVISNAAT
jgi:YebC/PmpR family DNA-binding regulatory protein